MWLLAQDLRGGLHDHLGAGNASRACASTSSWRIGWKLLLPAALVNVLITAVGIVTNLVVLVALEVVAAVALFVLISWLGEHAGDARAEAAERSAPARPAHCTPCAMPTAVDAEGASA